MYGRHFILITDHKLLSTLFGPKKAIPPLVAAGLQRWAIILSVYNYEIENKPTSQHANVDSLSSLSLKHKEQSKDETAVSIIAQVEALPATTLQVVTLAPSELFLKRSLQTLLDLLKLDLCVWSKQSRNDHRYQAREYSEGTSVQFS